MCIVGDMVYIKRICGDTVVWLSKNSYFDEHYIHLQIIRIENLFLVES